MPIKKYTIKCRTLILYTCFGFTIFSNGESFFPLEKIYASKSPRLIILYSVLLPIPSLEATKATSSYLFRK